MKGTQPLISTSRPTQFYKPGTTIQLVSPLNHSTNSPTPLKNMTWSVGMMTFPTEWKVIKIHGSKPPTRLLFYQHYPLVNIPKIAGKSTHFING